jgi:ubiquinone/menaquinone biosynthesis C-methylase UbiE
MNSKFSCPKCKKLLDISTNELICNDCKIMYSNKEGHIDFLGERDFKIVDISKDKLNEMIQNISSYGYEKASLQFLKDPIIKPHLLDVKSADSIFHCIGKNNLRCLEIGSNLGKITENLSHIFHEVYSLETSKEKIEIQKKRFQYLNRKNIIFLRCNPLELPFPENYFDLIISNEKFELCESFNINTKTEKGQIKFLNEVKRVLTKEGCLCLSVRNKFGLPKLFGVEKIKKNKKSEVCSITGYKKLFKKTNLYFKSYWVLPSIRKPYFSGKIDDDVSYQWLLQNVTDFLLKRKKSRFKNFLLLIIKKVNKIIIKSLTKYFVPSFIFCCYKNDIPTSLEDSIITNSNTTNFVMISRSVRIIYILFGKNKKPGKLVSLNRYGYEIPNEVIKCERVFPKMKDPVDRLWMEEWIDGHPIELSRTDEVIASLNWLHQFQKNTSDEVMTKKFVEDTEINHIRKGLMKIKNIPLEKYEMWLKEYLSYVDEHVICKTAIHGDFWYGNILIETKTNKVKVIDWENFKPIGNPFWDYLAFIFNFMTELGENKVEEFKLHYNSKEKLEIIKKLQTKISEHFGFEFKLIILLRWIILRKITQDQPDENNKKIKEYIQMLEFISNKE